MNAVPRLSCRPFLSTCSSQQVNDQNKDFVKNIMVLKYPRLNGRFEGIIGRLIVDEVRL